MDENKLFLTFPVLTADDLQLKKIRTKDFDDFYELCSNDALYLYRPATSIKNKSVAYNLISHYERDFYHHKALYLGIYQNKEVPKLVGLLELYNIDPIIDMITIGYSINEAYWNQGIATKAVQTTLSYLFDIIHVNRVQAYVMTENMSSKHVLWKNHFTFEGTIRQGIYWPSKGVLNIDLFSVLHEEYIQFC